MKGRNGKKFQKELAAGTAELPGASCVVTPQHVPSSGGPAGWTTPRAIREASSTRRLKSGRGPTCSRHRKGLGTRAGSAAGKRPCSTQTVLENASSQPRLAPRPLQCCINTNLPRQGEHCSLQHRLLEIGVLGAHACINVECFDMRQNPH